MRRGVDHVLEVVEQEQQSALADDVRARPPPPSPTRCSGRALDIVASRSAASGTQQTPSG